MEAALVFHTWPLASRLLLIVIMPNKTPPPPFCCEKGDYIFVRKQTLIPALKSLPFGQAQGFEYVLPYRLPLEFVLRPKAEGE